LELKEDTDIDTSASNYRVASIMGGFFNNYIRNNVIREGRGTGLALYSSFFHNVVEGNRITNCQGGSYLFSAAFLARPVWNVSNGNVIVNNTFEGGGSTGFTFAKYADAKNYFNVFANNNIVNNKGIYIKDEEAFIFDGNNIVGEDAEINLSGNVNANTFGAKYPVAPYPGQEFFDTAENVKKRWNGNEWIEI
jgi:hypothetical protein